MLFLNAVFQLGVQQCRLLHVEPSTNRAWTIDIKDDRAVPIERTWSDIHNLPAPDSSSNERVVRSISATPAMRRKRDEALERIGALIQKVPEIFDANSRGQMVRELVAEKGCSKSTVYKDLRRYWAGGQSPSALLANFNRCGPRQTKISLQRGGRSKLGVPHYDLTESDIENFHRVIKNHYLADGRVKMSHSYQRLVNESYLTIDGNGDSFVRPPGERPTVRQFEYFVRANYPLEHRLRCRLGNKDYEREHRAKLGTVLADCLGVGHYYEADATISDVYLVASEDVRQIVGKPTVYFITDRKSRLIVGWYVGLENPSWACARLAILSISQDKAAMCARYGVEYRTEDWPAHEVFPKEFLADRGELLTRASSQISEVLAVTVTNVPGQRGDWKPIAETGFKQHRAVLEDGTPGFDPPENAKKRQGKHYEKDACLTLKQFIAIVLNAIIAHNRAQMKGYDLSLKELGDGVEPSPVEIWNHNIKERTGLLPRFSETAVHLALLPRSEATVTEEGILFNGCLYASAVGMAENWFGLARKKRFKVALSYDTRLVDTVYVQNPNRTDDVIECHLTARSDKYRGLSFAEVYALERIRARLNPTIEQSRLQTTADLRRMNDAIIKDAKKALSSAGSKLTRSARRADTKEARSVELQHERQESRQHARSGQPATVHASTNHAQVISLSARSLGSATAVSTIPVRNPLNESEGAALKASGKAATLEQVQQPTTNSANVKNLSMAEKIREMKERMRDG